MISYLLSVLTVAAENEEVRYRFMDFIRDLTAGINIALLGAGIAAVVAGIGSALAVSRVGEAVSGLMSENPSLFGKALVLQALPGTQGLYGFIVAFLIILKLGFFGGNVPDLTFAQGMYFVFAALPVAVGGYFSALKQGRVAAAGVTLLAKQPEASGKSITSAGLVELYAIFALIISLLLVWFNPIV
jgi:V/A-type H+-transporting ATPase subunit K